ncbi:hypothetical protein D7V64_04000 [Acinetobacter cumulans]|jgi:hypothetical protein|uniref:Uncharacterized protein n=1 Tax=Acinetobacter cumulans TaxID=2136182 RepID=A0A3A8GI62_9GAMM|nr:MULTISPECIES: hypothetical protein [Acinetobacter]NWK72884.1 hypothetical protein [Acinetobacter sp. SwsAc6]QCO20408.1 hypothetical protein C9E88_002165 [Acinetobacter cumulans]RFS30640.1 hypothetical protein DYI81_09450 [Acinetobacter sp. SWAC5]RKG43482.1 hypothetical protein D7V51_09880 [Acinetobacter cumulans]RKG51373.1 hypothetical protein D7V68_01760 [Acinetobacter cumulans]
MNIIKTHSTLFSFWGFIVLMLTAISIALFSESQFNDQFAYSTMPIALIGILLSASFLAIDAIFELCNS